jgi:hypothetical protein
MTLCLERFDHANTQGHRAVGTERPDRAPLREAGFGGTAGV